MIVLSSADPLLCAAMRGVARPDEEVVTDSGRGAEALLYGFPRLYVVAAPRTPAIAARDVPTVYLDDGTLSGWEADRLKPDVPRPRRDQWSLRLRMVLGEVPFSATWVDRTLADLARAAGGGLPFAFTAFARHVLEFPRGYTELTALAEEWRMSAGALKERFRRRGLESPFLYLRWCRILAVAEVMSDRETTVAAAASRLGFTSGGNLCRTVRSLTGITPRRLRDPVLRSVLAVSFAGRYLGPSDVEAWGRLDDAFRHPRVA